MGIGGECARAGARRCFDARSLARCVTAAAHRARAGGLALARLPDSSAGAGQRPSLRHALHAAARPRPGRRCRRPAAAAGAAGRRPRPDPARHVAGRRGHEGDFGRVAADRPAPARAAIRTARLPRRHARRRSTASRRAWREETQGTAPATWPPRRARRRCFRGGTDEGRRQRGARSLSDARGQRLEGPARHRPDPARWRRELHPPGGRRHLPQPASARS